MSGARAICHTALQIRLIKETSFREEIVRRSRLYGGGCWRPRQPSWLDLRYENGRLGRRLARRLPGGLSLQVSFHSVDHSCQPIQGRNENLEQVGSILSPNQNPNRNFLKKWSKFRHINSYSFFFDWKRWIFYRREKQQAIRYATSFINSWSASFKGEEKNKYFPAFFTQLFMGLLYLGNGAHVFEQVRPQCTTGLDEY